jgi:putative transposase
LEAWLLLFIERSVKYGALQSMSRRGNCYDNAHAESFWSRFKAELLDGGYFPGLVEAKLEISCHIAYYNAGEPLGLLLSGMGSGR